MEIEKVTFNRTFRVSDIVLLSIGIRRVREFNPPTWFQYVWKNLPFIISFFILFYTTLGEAIYLFVALHNNGFLLLEFTAQLPCVLYCTIGVFKMFIATMRRNMLAELVVKLEANWPLKVATEVEKNIVEGYMGACIYGTTTFAIINAIMVSAFNFLPISEMVYNSRVWNIEKRQTPYYIWFPFDQFAGNLYYFIYVFHVLAGYILVLSNMGFDCLYCIPVAHLCMHFKLLHNKLENFVQADQKDIETLRECIRQHIVLIEFKQYLETVFSDVVFVNFFASSLVICLTGFQVTAMTGYNLVKYSLFLLCFLIELFMLCYYGEQLLENSTQVAISAYNSRWYETDLECRKMIAYIMQRSQKPIVLTALQFYVISMQSFSKILSTSWSYFTLLKTVYKELPNHGNNNVEL